MSLRPLLPLWQEIQESSLCVTEGIRIDVRASYLRERSLPSLQRYAFAYTVRTQNEGRLSVLLLGRHWTIHDMLGKVMNVRDASVVRKQRILHPGESLEDTNTVTLTASRGEMHGICRMHTIAGRTFSASIAPFLLTVPYTLN